MTFGRGNSDCETVEKHVLDIARLTAVSKQISEADLTHCGLEVRFTYDLPKMARHFRLTINCPML